MQKLILFFTAIVLTTSCSCQTNLNDQQEFSKNKNGLIYSDEDIRALKFVVDSLNLKFKTCDVNKPFLANAQSAAVAVEFRSEKDDLMEIKKLLETKPELNEVLEKFRQFIYKTDSSLLVIAAGQTENGKQIYLSGNPEKGFNRDYTLEGLKVSSIDGWIFTYDKKRKSGDYYSLSCIYFPIALSSRLIPSKYGQLLQYVDCMIDTNANIFLKNNFTDGFNDWSGKNIDYQKLVAFVNTKMHLQNSKEDDEYKFLSADKIQFLKDSLVNDPYVIKTTRKIIDSCIANNQSNEVTEELASIFVSKQIALQLKRSRRVMGMCSQDQSPRIHALNIAMLAAETHSWDIFLRSHLNIMNDRFDRRSDGSYAWGTRKTYIKELETLDINVVDMMLGLCLRASNTAPNHYNGTVWRIGKALAESKDREQFEDKAKKMLKDDALDQFNRSLVFLLLNSYLNTLDNSDERKSKISALKNACSEYPAFLQPAIKHLSVSKNDE